jgi:hypothetical protein
MPTPARRFPPPWSVEETGACFIVRDNGGQKLAYVYYQEEPGRRSDGQAVVSRRSEASNSGITRDLAVLAHSPGEFCEPPAELAGRLETRTAPMVTVGAGDTGPVVGVPG